MTAVEEDSMPAKTNGVPAYQRIQGAIRRAIESGGLLPGDAVPSERKLAHIHEVSLMTARHALATLEQEGVVERRRGIGTFVSPPKIHFNKLMSYTEQMRGRSMTAGSKVLFAEIVDDEPEGTARLSLSPKSEVLKLQRLRQVASEPFAVETCYFSAKQFAGLLKEPLERESLFKILERRYDQTNQVIVPRLVQLTWPAQQLTMKLRLDDMRVNGTIDPDRAQAAFSRPQLKNITTYDLARGPDQPVGQVQRTGGTTR